ncbi:MAG TPA: response regulator [Noviherbaspirillum sp.]|uniref:response regulator n=1 Tax=Noviherbaspirillum sp. TaxID=1926288 RepID=UPI002B466B89|nr:response regulator [Noviherbaspirillum sp.]HJV87482.1 response regulator [Noviherbaspirillum sp.]
MNHLAPITRFAFVDEEPAVNFPHLHVLVVDDLATMRRVVSSLLREELGQARISEAADGVQELQLLKSAKTEGRPVDFVVTDCNMPNMDGITLLQKIRETPHLQHVPVLMVTAEATRDVILAAARAGADGYIVKPFNAATLRLKLDQILNRKKCQHRHSAVLA